MTDPRFEKMKQAIAVMTAWTEVDEDATLLPGVVSAIVDQAEDRHEALLDLTLGLTNLCGILLIRRETDLGVGPRVTLNEIALDFQ